ncbi:LacI family transcriptional regulator [Mangrovactinospora gilvigrisea]|uniref:LacI family transcriptional regulator n=1 Tax=Mangrovactinospora gilvigrisea TaxID=1428644 RepID=A0A1J7BBS1_9ACTN|nr:LacI family transcriptional regulator [Mangrovactinospora gilvigrisea]
MVGVLVAGPHQLGGPEKAITTALGALLAAERAALLSGRDDELVLVLLDAYTGLRWGELVGLEREYLRPGAVRVEWQLYQLDTGELLRCPPKDDSYRAIDLPPWLDGLLTAHLATVPAGPCPCHGLAYAFRGRGEPGYQGAVRMEDVARRAGVARATVSTLLNHPERVAEATADRIRRAQADLGYRRGPAERRPMAHWRRSSFASWVFTPAVSGWYPSRGASMEPHPVPVLAEPWPGVPVRGRGAAGRADASWLPIARGLTPHGLRHTHRSLMEQLGTEKVLMDERMGHSDGSVSARYAHVTPAMRARLMDGITGMWTESLRARKALSASSPVRTLDRLLRD